MRATAASTRRPYDIGQYLASGDRQNGPPSSCCVTATRTPESRRSPGGSAKARDPGYTLFDLADRLRLRGWLRVPAYTLTGNSG